MEIARNYANKKIGIIEIEKHAQNKEITSSPCLRLKSCYMILYLRKGSSLKIDFQDYNTTNDTLFFLSFGQHFVLNAESSGLLVYFNPEFYCIAFHDKELACNGILFDNTFEVPLVEINKASECEFFSALISDLKKELLNDDFWTEEMARTYLKQLIINSSRKWLEQEKGAGFENIHEDQISRRFSQLVEKHFAEFHKASDYSGLLHISTKTLNRRIVKEKGKSPDAIIKERIILQAKRLIVHTTMSIKEISAQLGYEDPSYFVRFFKIKTGLTPVEFKEIQFSKVKTN